MYIIQTGYYPAKAILGNYDEFVLQEDIRDLFKMFNGSDPDIKLLKISESPSVWESVYQKFHSFNSKIFNVSFKTQVPEEMFLHLTPESCWFEIFNRLLYCLAWRCENPTNRSAEIWCKIKHPIDYDDYFQNNQGQTPEKLCSSLRDVNSSNDGISTIIENLSLKENYTTDFLKGFYENLTLLKAATRECPRYYRNTFESQYALIWR
uniref:Uncharacterized protein n=1 Tax=Cacopsylla melanoneura TaxID=428564 RepID=A0A8D8YYK9_9HEMI